MESATTWFKQLFAIKSRHKPPPPPPSDDFGRNPYITPAQAAWLTSFYSEPDTEQGIRARAVAAATAAAADAAVAAARAAYEAVRVTTETATPLGGSRENWAAMNIQRVFRGFLARKALRALKGLVKIQAQVRGFLVRKRAAATLQSMEALVRAQASVRAKKIDLRPQFRTPKSLDNGHESPKIVEVDTWCRPKSRSKRVVISNWITESMSMEDRFRQPPSWHECSITNMPRYYYSRDISPTWRARSAMPKTRPVRSESAPKSRKGSLREVMGCRMKGRDEEAVDFKKFVTGKLGVN